MHCRRRMLLRVQIMIFFKLHPLFYKKWRKSEANNRSWSDQPLGSEILMHTHLEIRLLAFPTLLKHRDWNEIETRWIRDNFTSRHLGHGSSWKYSNKKFIGTKKQVVKFLNLIYSEKNKPLPFQIRQKDIVPEMILILTVSRRFIPWEVFFVTTYKETLIPIVMIGTKLFFSSIEQVLEQRILQVRCRNEEPLVSLAYIDHRSAWAHPGKQTSRFLSWLSKIK